MYCTGTSTCSNLQRVEKPCRPLLPQRVVSSRWSVLVHQVVMLVHHVEIPWWHGWAARLGCQLARRVHLVVDVCARDAWVAALERRTARVKACGVAAERHGKERLFMVRALWLLALPLLWCCGRARLRMEACAYCAYRSAAKLSHNMGPTVSVPDSMPCWHRAAPGRAPGRRRRTRPAGG